MTHYWRIRAKLHERFGQPCRVLAYGKLNSCLVEFADRFQVITSRWSVRKLKPRISESPAQQAQAGESQLPPPRNWKMSRAAMWRAAG